MCPNIEDQHYKRHSLSTLAHNAQTHKLTLFALDVALEQDLCACATIRSAVSCTHTRTHTQTHTSHTHMRTSLYSHTHMHTLTGFTVGIGAVSGSSRRQYD